MSQVISSQGRANAPFGILLRRARQAHTMSQKELAERAGCDKSLISHLERGTKDPTESVFAHVAQALGLSAQEEARLEKAAGLSRHTTFRELERLVAALTRDAHDDDIANYLLRNDLERLTSAWSELTQAVLWLRHTQLEPARDQLERLYSRTELTPALRALAGCYLAEAYQRLGNLVEATRVLDILRQSDLTACLPAAQDRLLRANMSGQRGDIVLREGKYASARDLYEDANTLYLQMEASLSEEDSWLGQVGLGLGSLLLAKVAIFQHHEDQALLHCARAEEHWTQALASNRQGRRSMQQLEGLLRTKEFQAWAHTQKGSYQRAEELRKEVGYEAKVNHNTEFLTKNRLYSGDDWRHRIEHAIDVHRRLPHFRHVSSSVTVQAIRQEAQPWMSEAEKAYGEAIALCEGAGGWKDPLIWGRCLSNMAIIKRLQGAYAEAESLLIRAEQFELDHRQRGRLPSIYESWGELNWDMGQLRRARERFEQALKALDELDQLQEYAGLDETGQRVRIKRRLDSVVNHAPAFPHPDVALDDQQAHIWLEWRQVIRRIIHLLDQTLWRTGADPLTTRDMSVEWMHELASFEALEGPRLLAQDTLSLSLSDTLPHDTDEVAVVIHSTRYKRLHTQLDVWPTQTPDPAAHDVCCRPAVEGAMFDPLQHARVRGALGLLNAHPTAYRLDAGLFWLPLSFAVKGARVLVELPPQTVRQYKMQVAEYLDKYVRPRQFCFRFDDPTLADDLRDLFATVAQLARQSTMSATATELHEESTEAWLADLLTQWDSSGVAGPVSSAI